MNWEETIEFIRTVPEYEYLVNKAYFEADLALNVERFKKSDEFFQTLKILKTYQINAKSILDIGSGNGISAIAFALAGYKVTVSEPDPSDTVGSGAIRKLKEIYHITNLNIYEEFAEKIGFHDMTFDIIYIRQAMHHAKDLEKFISNLSRLLKPNGLLITVRDHVVFNEKDKQWFLERHPLHKYYGGENAFSPQQYRAAMENAGLRVKKELKFFDSVINYFPMTDSEIDKLKDQYDQKKSFKLKIRSIIKKVLNYSSVRNSWKLKAELAIPGRMYSYICIKK